MWGGVVFSLVIGWIGQSMAVGEDSTAGARAFGVLLMCAAAVGLFLSFGAMK